MFKELYNDFNELKKKAPEEELERIATEVLEELEFDKEAGIKEKITGKYKIKDEDKKTRFWKDRVAGSFIANVPFNVLNNATKNIQTQEAMKKLMGNADEFDTKKLLAAGVNKTSLAVALAGGAAAAGINAARGKNLAKANDVEFTKGDVVKSTLIPFVTPESIVKKKLREKAASEVLEEMYKEAVSLNTIKSALKPVLQKAKPLVSKTKSTLTSTTAKAGDKVFDKGMGMLGKSKGKVSDAIGSRMVDIGSKMSNNPEQFLKGTAKVTGAGAALAGAYQLGKHKSEKTASELLEEMYADIEK